MNKIDLINNINKIHTTELGKERIKRNLNLKTDDVVNWCKEKIKEEECEITKIGKNYSAIIDNIKITINAYSFTIITAHKENT